MTPRMYQFTTHVCLVVAAVSIFLFDWFTDPLIPGTALAAAGLLAVLSHVYACFHAVADAEIPAATEEKANAYPPTAEADSTFPEAFAAAESANLLFDRAHVFTSQEEPEKSVRLALHIRYCHLIAEPDVFQPVFSRVSWPTVVATAIEVAKSLPPHYEVTLTPDRQLKIRQVQLQPYEQSVRATVQQAHQMRNPEVSQTIH